MFGHAADDRREVPLYTLIPLSRTGIVMLYALLGGIQLHFIWGGRVVDNVVQGAGSDG